MTNLTILALLLWPSALALKMQVAPADFNPELYELEPSSSCNLFNYPDASHITYFPEGVRKCCYFGVGSGCDGCVDGSGESRSLTQRDPTNWVKTFSTPSCLTHCCRTCTYLATTAGWNPCPVTTPPSPETKPLTAAVGAKGDPHLRNLKGEKFNVVRQGSAPLLKIATDSDGDALLKIMGRIQGASKCAQVTMITALNISGSWLEKNVEVKVGDQSEKAFHVIVNGQQVWSAGLIAPEYKDRMDWSAPKSLQYKRNFVFNHEADKFFVEELDTSKTAKTDPGIQIAMSSNPNLILKIHRPMRHPNSIPHLNMNVQGLGTVSNSLKVGGLLGTDDHSDWIANSDCKQFAITGEQRTTLDGSIATATY